MPRRSGPPWARRSHHPPEWWPEGEPWPPRGGGRGTALGRRFAVWGLILVALVITAGAIANHAGENWGPPEGEGPPGPFFWPPFALLAIGVGLFFLIRKITRTFRPLAHVIDAAERVAEGDYSVRVSTSGPPETHGVAGAFNTMVARLESNERQRKHLFSDIAHELRTPLSVVQGTIEGMIDDVYPKDTEHLAPLLDQTKVIARLLNDLQTVATTEAGMLALHRSVTDIGEVIAEAASSFTPMANERGIAVACDVLQVVELDVDPVRIRQVLDNLVSNAIRYTPEGGTISLRLSAMAGEVVITVRDTGRGMTQKEAARMFERFVKSADSGGSGLGLAIAKSLVEAHGGTIGARSAPGQGATVTIRLPRTG